MSTHDVLGPEELLLDYRHGSSVIRHIRVAWQPKLYIARAVFLSNLEDDLEDDTVKNCIV